MHEEIRENLEEYLRGPAAKIPQEFHAHLGACQDCASELRLLKMQSEMLQSIRAASEIEPRAGFYARVMERIEQQGQPASIWSVLLQPRFGRRLAVATAALALLLAGYLVSTEPGEQGIAAAPAVVMTDTASDAIPQNTLQQQQQRDAVLVNLASFRQ
jgi:hypothetical protein